MKVQRALVMCRADPNGCPRPRHATLTLTERYRVTVLGTAAMTDPRADSMLLPPLPLHTIPRARRIARLAARRYGSLLWSPDLRQLARVLREQRFDVVVCHDLDLLPLAAASAGPARLVFDAREYYPRHFEDRWTWRVLYGPMNRILCREYLPLCDLVITVSEGIAAEYARVYDVAPWVMPSMAPFHDLSPSEVDPDRIQLVHHGWANPSRRIEGMIQVMDHTDGRYALDLMLMPLRPSYDRFLKQECQARPNVRMAPPVPYQQLVATTSRYDIGVFLCPPTTFNLLHALPNKLFEFIQARLAIAIGPSPDMRDVVDRWGCGTVADTFEPRSLAGKLNELSVEEVRELKNRSHRAAATLHAGATGRELLARLEAMTAAERDRTATTPGTA